MAPVKTRTSTWGVYLTRLLWYTSHYWAMLPSVCQSH